MLRHFFSRLAYNFISLCFILFLCAFILTYKAPPFVENFLGRNPSLEDIEKASVILNTEEPGFISSLKLAYRVLTLNTGLSRIQKEAVTSSLLKGLKVTASLTTPSLAFSLILSLGLCFFASLKGSILKPISSNIILILGCFNVVFLLLGLKILLCTKIGFAFFPFYGWEITGFQSFLKYATAPILILSVCLTALYAPLFSKLFEEEEKKTYVRTLKSLGCPPWRLFFVFQMKSLLPVLLTHYARLAPSYILAGSLIIENHFNIPGIGFLIYESSQTGDKETLLLIIGVSALFYLALQEGLRYCLPHLDPRGRTHHEI